MLFKNKKIRRKKMVRLGIVIRRDKYVGECGQLTFVKAKLMLLPIVMMSATKLAKALSNRTL